MRVFFHQPNFIEIFWQKNEQISISHPKVSLCILMAVGLFLEKKFVAVLIVLQKDFRTIHVFSMKQKLNKSYKGYLTYPTLCLCFQNHNIMCTILEAGSYSRPVVRNPTPDPFYIDQVKVTLSQLDADDTDLLHYDYVFRTIILFTLYWRLVATPGQRWGTQLLILSILIKLRSPCLNWMLMMLISCIVIMFSEPLHYVHYIGGW